MIHLFTVFGLNLNKVGEISLYIMHRRVLFRAVACMYGGLCWYHQISLNILLVEKSTLGSPYSGFDTSLIPISPISCVMVIRVDCFFDDPSNFPEMFLN